MFNYQRGILPKTAEVLGIFIPAIFFIRITTFLVPRYIDAYNAQSFTTVIDNSIKLAIGLVLYLIIPMFLGIFLSGLFPSIHLAKHGIVYKYFGGVIKGRVRWNEIETVKKLTGRYWAIIINRPGLSLLNGLYMNELYGRIVRCGYPVILLSPNMDDVEKLVQEIEQMSRVTKE